jgi:hypothetical protein
VGDPKDLEAVRSHDASSKLPTSNLETSWQQALSWADFAKQSQPSGSLPAFQAAFHLLPEIFGIGHSIPVRQDAIRRLDISDVASTAVQTSIDLSDPRAAVEIIEQGLATTFQQMLQLKTDVEGLPADVAKHLSDLSSQLYSGKSTNPIGIVEDRNKVLQDIRTQPGFEDYLLPKSYDRLRHASQGGPVVILSSHQDHCDAIILPNPTSDPVHVLLPSATLHLLQSQGQTLKELLNYCNVRHRGQSSVSGLFGQHEDLSKKPTQESFKDILDCLWLHVVSPVYQALRSVSQTIVLVFPN